MDGYSLKSILLLDLAHTSVHNTERSINRLLTFIYVPTRTHPSSSQNQVVHILTNTLAVGPLTILPKPSTKQYKLQQQERKPNQQQRSSFNRTRCAIRFDFSEVLKTPLQQFFTTLL